MFPIEYFDTGRLTITGSSRLGRGYIYEWSSLVLRCVGDKDHSKISDIVAKVEKVAKTATLDSEKRVAYRGNPQNNYTPQRRSSSIRCYNCNQWGHRAARCRNRRGDQAQTGNSNA